MDPMTSKCIREAESIIRWYCNTQSIHDVHREEYWSAGMMGLSVAMSRHDKVKYQLNTYTGHFVKGYLKHHHRNEMGWDRDRVKSKTHWDNFKHPASIDDHTNSKYLSVEGVQDRIVAKDLISKVTPSLSPQQSRVMELLSEGRGPAEIGKIMGVTRFTINSYRVKIKEKIQERANEHSI